ncbi:hypothetical protein TWF730_008472 [Orbilia blumenaviensis]|uniref:Xylanolytic transcriptional activator regulatory domain-containing protein n=1 Tax=Orbilia blumenaviensis TaxID=1796055 RepID=A0AAV9V5J6_9PEZI
MAIYLETVALPYPLRWTLEYVAKVCKDLGLHRKLPDGKSKLGSAELEHRSRMFWSVFLLDQKLALQFGTTPIYRSEEVEIDEPGKNDMTDLISEGSALAISGTPQSIMLMQSLIAISRFIGPISRLNPQSNNAECQMNHIEQQLDDLENDFPQHILAWKNSDPLDPVLLDGMAPSCYWLWVLIF